MKAVFRDSGQVSGSIEKLVNHLQKIRLFIRVRVWGWGEEFDMLGWGL